MENNNYNPKSTLKQPQFLPMTRQEMTAIGWQELDILFITGDAYIDHPTFAMALLGRWLVAHGYRVGIVAQPQWTNIDNITQLGRPKLFAAISAGAMDSMLAHYTAFRKKRHDDAYTPGGKCGARPNRASLVYSNLVRQAFPGLPLILGGIEASLRRTTHYDFWSDKLRRSILFDTRADLLVYGMGENPILEIAKQLQNRGDDDQKEIFNNINGTAKISQKPPSDATKTINLPSHEEIIENHKLLITATKLTEQQVHQQKDWLVQSCNNRYLVIAPPAKLLSTAQMDFLYGLPFAKTAHPSYQQPIPALAMIAHSITTHRGCGGGCSFCTLAIHQGRRMQSRSQESIMSEVSKLSQNKKWHGSISDMGGPSANMWQAKCMLKKDDICQRNSCLHPTICPHFKIDQSAISDMLYQVKSLPKVKNIRIASGVRFDLALQDEKYCKDFIHDFVGGQLKIAPEHISDSVLKRMRKPQLEVFEKFLNIFQAESAKAGKEQYVIPYLMSAFPGCTEQDMHNLARWLQRKNWKPQQVQCFIPTPSSMATAIYFAECDADGKPLKVAKSDADRMRQHYILMPNKDTKQPNKNSANSAKNSNHKKSKFKNKFKPRQRKK